MKSTAIAAGNSSAIASRNRPVLLFFLLVLALSVPFYLIGAIVRIDLLPGLPLSALAAFCPVVAAGLLVYRENGMAGVTGLLKRSIDYSRIRSRVWYVPIILLMPGATALTYGVMRLMGSPLPSPQISVLSAVILFVAFFIAALGEELGWSGYITEPLQERWNALPAAILLGIFWALWHWVPLLEAGRSSDWIGWWSLFTVSLRVLIVWLYNNTGKSVFAAALFHAMVNESTLLFPNYFDPRITGLIVAAEAVIVTVVWGPRRLTRQISR